MKKRHLIILGVSLILGSLSSAFANECDNWINPNTLPNLYNACQQTYTIENLMFAARTNNAGRPYVQDRCTDAITNAQATRASIIAAARAFQ